MGQAALKIEPHPDQSIFDACAKWQEAFRAWVKLMKERPDDDPDVLAMMDVVDELLHDVCNLNATTVDGVRAKALAAIEDGAKEHLLEDHAGSRIIICVLDELVAVGGRR